MSFEEKIRVLFVDDDQGIRDGFAFNYGEEFDLTLAANHEEVQKLFSLDNMSFEVAVVDMRLGEDLEGGLKLIKWLKKYDPLLECLVLTAHPETDNIVDCMKADAFNYVVKAKPDTIPELSNLIIKASEAPVSPKNQALLLMLKEQKRFFEKMVYRDPFFFGHGERIAEWSSKLADLLNLKKKSQWCLEFAAHFHDIGKEKLSFAYKPGKLTREEEARWRRYPQYGHEMLKSIFAAIDLEPKDILDAVLYHRENWDGSGFPRGFQGETIPLLSRILAVACEFDHGFFQPGLRFLRDPKQAVERLRGLKETRLDPTILEHLIKAYEKGEISLDYPIRWREDEFHRITKLVQEERYEAARMAGEQWIREMNPDTEFDCIRAAASVGLGDVFAPIDTYREIAIGYYTDAVELHPAYAEAYYRRGLCFRKQNCWEEAASDFEVATAIIPTYIEAFLERADIYLQDFKFIAAGRLYDRVVALDEGNIRGLLGKANIFLEQALLPGTVARDSVERYNAALSCLEKAVKETREILDTTDLEAEEKAEYEHLWEDQKHLMAEVRSRLKAARAKANKINKSASKD